MIRGRLIRRVRSCHGSDCPLGPHPIRRSRCVIVTRIDDLGRRCSEVWVSGDNQEQCRRRKRKRIPEDQSAWLRGLFRHKRQRISFDQPAVYGGGFCERVELPPVRLEQNAIVIPPSSGGLQALEMLPDLPPGTIVHARFIALPSTVSPPRS